MTRTLPALIAPLLLGVSFAVAAPANDDQLLETAKVSRDTPAMLAWVRRHTLTPTQRMRLRALLPKLGSEDYAIRDAASREVVEFGPPALVYLRRALTDPDEEVKERLRAAIADLEPKSQPAVAAAIGRLLRNRPAAEVVPVLLDGLPEMDGEAEDEALATLAVLAVAEGKVMPRVVEALHDPEPARRAAAALVLGRSGTAEQRAAVRKLLTDSDCGVRFRAAQGLLTRRDPAALAPLAALVGDAPTPLALRAEELLAVVAQRRGSRLLWADEPAARRRCRAAWESWVKFCGSRDLASADVDLLPFNRSLQAAAVSRALFLALVQGDQDARKQLTSTPFLGPDEKVSATDAELDPVLTDLNRNLSQEVLVPPPALVVRFCDPRQPAASPALKEFLGRFPRQELRCVRLSWRFPEKGREVEEIVFIVRTTAGRSRVISAALSQ